MTTANAEPQTHAVTAITLGVTRRAGRRAARRMSALAHRLPLARLVRMAETLAARIQLGIGGAALMVVAQLVGDLIPRRR